MLLLDAFVGFDVSSNRPILHVDLDSFFVGVERILDPRLKGRPVAVGGAPESRGVVSSASYEARACGVRSGMAMAKALRLCPNLIRKPGQREMYARASRAVRRVLDRFSPVVEPLSVDEAWLDLRGTGILFGCAVDTAERIRREVLRSLGLDLTVGVARNRLVSKVASAFAKPKGLFEVYPGREADFLAPLPVRALPGIGPATENRLRKLGLFRLGELAAAEVGLLRKHLGRSGPLLNARALGEDNSSVRGGEEVNIRRSIGHEETFAVDIHDPLLLKAHLRRLLDRASRRLRAEELLAKKVSVKLRWSNFHTVTRDSTLTRHTDNDLELAESAMSSFEKMATDRPMVRLVGIRLSSLIRGFRQDSFFEDGIGRSRRLVSAIDVVRGRHGFDAVKAGEAAWLPIS
ncbi:MAG TPA: DNA polymerase IV [Planctomycetes bacterium]|nr:DNA polymerase IV [Planctomycetota bacterium]